MNIYVLIGFNFEDEFVLTEADKLLYKKIYVVSKPAITDDENIEVVSDINILKFYKTMDFETSDENIIFIDCRKNKTSKSYLDVMYLLNTGRFDNRSYYIMKGNVLKLSDYPLIKNYNPWLGDAIPSNLPEKKYIQEAFKNLSIIARSYLKAGFHKYNNNNAPIIEHIPDAWMLNVNNSELCHIINYYGLIPSTSINRALEFLHNAQYRFIICDTIVRVVANYLVRNGVSNTVEIDNWFNYKNWDIQKLNFYF